MGVTIHEIDYSEMGFLDSGGILPCESTEIPVDVIDQPREKCGRIGLKIFLEKGQFSFADGYPGLKVIRAVGLVGETFVNRIGKGVDKQGTLRYHTNTPLWWRMFFVFR